jgi:hypothetical protein
MNRSAIFSALLICMCGCASDPSNPYSGSGGLFLGTPSKSAIESGKIDFSPSRFASFKVGVTTKKETVALLGKPAGWLTRADGTSQLEYDFVAPEIAPGMRRVMAVFLTFDANRLLTRLTYPGYDSGK